MKLDYNENINEFGDNIVRLYDFDKSEAIMFRQAIKDTIISSKNNLNLSSLKFIQPRNCNLILRITEEDLGIIPSDNENLFCDLTIQSYVHMLSLLEPFCLRETNGYQWLYDIDSETDLLFSPAGTW
jgi:CTP:phosphocholine cytidylyltransferase-like protein